MVRAPPLSGASMKTRSRIVLLSTGVLGLLAGALLSFSVQRGSSAPAESPAQAPDAAQHMARPPDGSEELDEEERHTIALFERASRSVCFITTRVERVDLWTRGVTELPAGTGSGFLWDDRGHVVTNFHVVQDADSATVTLGEDAYPAKVVGYSRDQDLAVLRIDAPREKLRPLPVGSSARLKVGQKVFAIGNPFGLDHSLTSGLVSALGRSMTSVSGVTIFDVIQTDAAINPGNSGGPLLDSAGRLVGVNTAIYSPSGANAGIGFAVPADTVNRIVPELITKGRVVRPVLGVELADDRRDVAMARRLGVEGAIVARIVPGSGAAEAGLRGARRGPAGRILSGDVIEAIDGKPVRGASDLLGRLGAYKAGDRVRLRISRDGERREVDVRLQAPDE
jgi:S1-C subfamily serine protease